MKLGIISDIHLDQSTYTIYPEDYDADLWINAGDTATNRLMYDYFHTLFPPDKYFFIDGNHDFWGRDIKHPGHYTKSMMIGEIKIAGATLWTDLTKGIDWLLYKDGLADTRYMPTWNEQVHNEHFQYHKNFLLTSDADVIVSHHAPSFRSTHERFKGDPHNASFASELGFDILDMKKPPKLWIHGHMHNACDYMIGETRVVSNPRGYPSETHCKHYEPLILEI